MLRPTHSVVLVAVLALGLGGMVGACSGAGASAAPELRFAVFLGQMVAARDAVEARVKALTDAGLAAATGAGTDDVRTAAEELGDIATQQGAWLAANPPADCYREAHDVAMELTRALRDASTRAIDWADALDQPELSDPAAALADVQAASEAVTGNVTDLTARMDAVTCLD